jgi:8-oxo-dGTP diphosphatase
MNHVGSSVNLLVIKDGKLLLARRISQKWMDGKLQIPGGKTEAGESPLAAVLREAKEELGIDIPAEGVRHELTAAVKDGDNEYFALEFRLLNPEDYTFIITEPHKCGELVWVDLANLPEDTIGIFKTIARGINAGQGYMQIGYDEQVE